MLIPLGFLAASGGVAGDFVLLDERVLTSTEASVTFSSLNTLAAGYKHLQIRAAAKSSATGDINGDTLLLQFNGVTSASYAFHGMYAVNVQSQIDSFNAPNQTSLRAGRVSSNFSGSSADTFGATIIDLLDFSNTSKNKTIKSMAGHLSNRSWLEMTSGVFLSTDAVTSIRLFGGTGSFLQHSRFSLYGVK